MALFATKSDELSRTYVSNVKEATIGVAQTLDRSFYLITNSVTQKAADEKRKGVTGYFNAIQRVRTNQRAGGQLVDNMYPAIVNWAMKMLFGGAATTASVSPSTTVYSHTWNTITMPPSTFTMHKQHAGGLATETLTGLAISEVKFKSVDGVGTIEIKVDGCGSGYVIGNSEPSVTPTLTADQEVMIGAKTTCLIDGVAVSTGLFLPTWEVVIRPGVGVVPSGGSSDGSATRIDKNGQRSVTATMALYITDATLFTEWKAKTNHSYKFQFIGPTIDAGNSLTSLVEVLIPVGQNITEIKAEIGKMGVKEIPLTIEALIDTAVGATQGFDVVVKTVDLQTAAQI